MQPPHSMFYVELDHVVGSTKPEGRISTQGASADDRDAPRAFVPKARIEKLRPVLMTLEAQTEPPVDEVLQDFGVHVIDLQGNALRVGLPDADPEPIDV